MAPSRRKQTAAGKGDNSHSAPSVQAPSLFDDTSGSHPRRLLPYRRLLLILLGVAVACAAYFALHNGLVPLFALNRSGTRLNRERHGRISPFEVRNLPGRGKGLIATRAIEVRQSVRPMAYAM